MADSQILINPSHVSASDRSIQYGDACFTTMYAEDGKILLLPAHIARLQAACSALSIAFSDWLLLQTELAKLASEIENPRVIKIVLSRGSGGRGYQPPVLQQTLCIISTHLANPILPIVCVERIGLSKVELQKEQCFGGIKHNNRLPQVLARQQNMSIALDKGQENELNINNEDVLMCNEYGHVIEASSANIFYEIDGVWYTPPMDTYGVKGIMRDAWMSNLYQRGIIVNQNYHHQSMLAHAQSVLLTNAVRGVRPVHELRVGCQVYQLETHKHLSMIDEFITQAIE
jgi:4-amino-4-deoxychorismate lyase